MSARTPTTPPPGRPEVEDLSDLTWARVEKRLWAELDRAPSVEVAAAPRVAVAPSRRRWWLAAGALVAAAMIAVVAWPSGTSSTHMLPSRVATGSDATEVSFGDAAITVAPSSAVLLNGQADRGVSIVLERGSATFAVAPRAGRPPFVVHAGVVDVRVIGTRFSVSRSGDDARVVVTHGEVEVVAWGRREVLLAGASWSSDGVREAAVGGSAPVTNPGSVAAAHLSASVEPEPEAPPVSATPPSTSSRPPSTSAGSAAVTEEPPPAPPVSAVLSEPARKAEFYAAGALVVTDPAAALREYRRLSAGNDAWAANALYAGADLAFSRGDHDVAEKYVRAYLKRFPKGANAADAHALLERMTGGSQ